jgi:hypothetical protein
MTPDNIPGVIFDVIIGSGIKMIGNDEEVLNHAEMFNLREQLEEHLAKRQEVTHVVNQVTDSGNMCFVYIHYLEIQGLFL